MHAIIYAVASNARKNIKKINTNITIDAIASNIKS